MKLDRIEWSFINDVATAAAAMQSGEQDYWESVPPDLIPMMKQSSDLNVGPRLTGGTYYTLVMNHLPASVQQSRDPPGVGDGRQST